MERPHAAASCLPARAAKKGASGPIFRPRGKEVLSTDVVLIDPAEPDRTTCRARALVLPCRRDSISPASMWRMRVQRTSASTKLYPDLRRGTQKFLASTGRCATKSDLVAMGNQILSFEVPDIYMAPAFPFLESRVCLNLSDHQPYQSIILLHQAQRRAKLVAGPAPWKAEPLQKR
jgi:hypothetical protein